MYSPYQESGRHPFRQNLLTIKVGAVSQEECCDLGQNPVICDLVSRLTRRPAPVQWGYVAENPVHGSDPHTLAGQTGGATGSIYLASRPV